MSDVRADVAGDRAIVRVIGIVAAVGATDRLSHDADAEPVAEIDAILDRRGPTRVLGVAGAAGLAGIADRREGIRAPHRIVGIDLVQLQRVLPAEGQQAPKRLANTDILICVQPAPAAGVERQGLGILRRALGVLHSLRGVGQQA